MKKNFSKVLISIFIVYPFILCGIIINFIINENSNNDIIELKDPIENQIVLQLKSKSYKNNISDSLRTDFILRNYDLKIDQIFEKAQSYAILSEKDRTIKTDNIEKTEHINSILLINDKHERQVLNVKTYSFENEVPKFDQIDIQYLNEKNSELKQLKQTEISPPLLGCIFASILFYIVSLYGIFNTYKYYNGTKPTFIFLQFINFPALASNLKSNLITFYFLNFGLFPLSIVKYGIFGDWHIYLRFPIFSIASILLLKLYVKKKNVA